MIDPANRAPANRTDPAAEKVLELWSKLKPGDRQVVMRLLRSMTTKLATNRHLGFVDCWFCRTQDNCYLFQGRPRCRACKRRHARDGTTSILSPG